MFAGLTQQYKMSQCSEHCVRPWNKELCTVAKFYQICFLSPVGSNNIGSYIDTGFCSILPNLVDFKISNRYLSTMSGPFLNGTRSGKYASTKYTTPVCILIGSAKFSQRKICVHINCLGVRSSCIFEVLQHVSAAVFSSYSTKKGVKSRGPTVFIGPASCCPYVTVYMVGSNTSPSRKSLLQVLNMCLVYL